jgi:opine dehydrogenase
MARKPSVAVLGSGNVGVCLAGILSLSGVDVSLGELPTFEENISPIIEKGGIDVHGECGVGFARPAVVTIDIEEAIQGRRIIMFCMPAYGHQLFTRACAPYLVDGQLLIYISHFGSMRMARLLRELNVNVDITVGETLSCIYLSNKTGPTEALIRAKKEALPFAAFPGQKTQGALDELRKIFSGLAPAKNCFETSINNASQWEHPAGTLLNAGWIEARKGGFSFGVEGRTPAVKRLQEAMDAEKIKIAHSLDIECIPSTDILKRLYKHGTNREKYAYLKNAPKQIQHRYLTEDLSYGVVPIANIGHELGVSTPVIDSTVRIASVAAGIDFLKDGLSAGTLELAGLSADEMNSLVEFGWDTR